VADYDKLIPLLGSNRDGEVLAAARAIGRKLEADGRDWHWLAALICGGVPLTPTRRRPPKERPDLPSLDQCRQMVQQIITHARYVEEFNNAERRFLKAISVKFVMFRDASLKDWQRERIMKHHRRIVT
jgi:hypothetical protein